jgi:hypothetical protein
MTSQRNINYMLEKNLLSIPQFVSSKVIEFLRRKNGEGTFPS